MCDETSRIVETIDRLGNRNCNRIYGKMKTTDHGTILRILERRALRFRPDLRQVQDQGILGQQVDETGTLKVVGMGERAADSRDREMRAGSEVSGTRHWRCMDIGRERNWRA